MNFYEQVIILSPESSDDQVSQVLGKTRDLVEKNGGEIILQDIWGRRRTAYQIGKYREGLYAVLQFTADSTKIEELNTTLRLNRRVIRHLTVKLDPSIIKKKAVAETKKEEVPSNEQPETARTE